MANRNHELVILTLSKEEALDLLQGLVAIGPRATGTQEDTLDTIARLLREQLRRVEALDIQQRSCNDAGRGRS